MSKKILLVDDDNDMIMLVSRWLERAGYTLSVSNSGEEALELIKKDRPDLVLLDYAMPGMTGPEVLAAIRDDDKLLDLPVIFRTGKDDEESSDEMKQLKCSAVVSKADGKKALMEAIGNVIGPS